MESILRLLPEQVKEMMQSRVFQRIDEVQEIRLRIQRQVELSSGGTPTFLPYIFTKEDAGLLIGKLANHSFYTLDEELRKGYVTIDGGHRIGLAGKVILENGYVKAIRNLASFNIRIAREKRGAAEPLIPYLYNGMWKHTMIIGPPQTGKTTILRDLARLISSGYPSMGIPSFKTGIVDERSEIAGCVDGVPQLSLGTRVDVLDACPKAEGMMMMIRSMSPEVLVVDEIGREEDSFAIKEAVHAGISLVTTTHGRGFEDIRKRPILSSLIEEKVFERYIELSSQYGPGTISCIRDAEGRVMMRDVVNT
ncbi:MAG TPA: stage III sporulation protein AA [Bacillaceae bacterium]